MDDMDTTPTHPQPAYWFSLGRRAGQNGEWTEPEIDEYGHIFADADPPQEWIDAYVSGVRQGYHDLMTPTVPSGVYPFKHAVPVHWTRDLAHRFAARLNDWSVRVEGWADR
jgi:hypothetical protein